MNALLKVVSFLNALRRGLCCLLLSALLAGCATIPPPKRLERLELPLEQFYLNNTVYLSLPALCDYYRIALSYDYIGRQVVLKKADTEVKLLIDSCLVLVNGSGLDLGYPVVAYNGLTVIPLSFKDKVLDRFYPLTIAPKAPVPVAAARIKRVVVDAGHGGHDPGAIGKTGLREKDVNLDIARRLAKLLESQGIEVVMTRSSDRFISLEGRAGITNRADADFFISIHSNASISSRLNGFEVYYVTEKVDDSARARLAARNSELNIDNSCFYDNSLDLKATLWDMLYTQSRAESVRLAQDICEAASGGMGLKVLGVKGASFYVLKGSQIPAVLVEVGFVSNPQEERYLRNGFYRQQIAEAISQGIGSYGRQYQLASRAD